MADLNFEENDFQGRLLLGISLDTTLQVADTHQLTLTITHPDTIADAGEINIPPPIDRFEIVFHNIYRINLNYADQGKPNTIKRIYEMKKSGVLVNYLSRPNYEKLKHIAIEIESYEYSFIDLICEKIELIPKRIRSRRESDRDTQNIERTDE